MRSIRNTYKALKLKLIEIWLGVPKLDVIILSKDRKYVAVCIQILLHVYVGNKCVSNVKQ
jgi:hypothetical protein